MCDLHSKFEEDWTKTAVAIVDNRYLGQTRRQTDRQTNILSSDFISVQCHALRSADKTCSLILICVVRYVYYRATELCYRAVLGS